MRPVVISVEYFLNKGANLFISSHAESLASFISSLVASSMNCFLNLVISSSTSAYSLNWSSFIGFLGFLFLSFVSFFLLSGLLILLSSFLSGALTCPFIFFYVI